MGGERRVSYIMIFKEVNNIGDCVVFFIFKVNVMFVLVMFKRLRMRELVENL